MLHIANKAAEQPEEPIGFRSEYQTQIENALKSDTDTCDLNQFNVSTLLKISAFQAVYEWLFTGVKLPRIVQNSATFKLVQNKSLQAESQALSIAELAIDNGQQYRRCINEVASSAVQRQRYRVPLVVTALLMTALADFSCNKGDKHPEMMAEIFKEYEDLAKLYSGKADAVAFTGILNALVLQMNTKSEQGEYKTPIIPARLEDPI